ncbi:1-acyl-sn-glycerol-3-phosphate acyltransferase [Aureispira sp. CCB-QB1]|uniref:1-acyl-sn-glycerol-3-phosphate acyltransferase n=1 Tax=Aureispira sp. CCB-QB1 TaxID=1313421 RepID=UPI0006972F6C|nr:1-acyl-sn-glycerol-3-phosphate acyltransferase [Aureispira sp. CCB-QB1]
MLYQLLRFPLVILFFVFYKRIYITGKAALPSQAPTIIASNHSTAFIEQILVAGLQKRSVFFWARGSVFEEKWSFPKLFRQVHLIPIWRPQEGLKKMQQNQQIFKDSKEILLKGNLFFIAPEGNSVPEKRLRPFKTGTARLALLAAAEHDFEREVFISPTGVNYTYHCDFRSEVMLHFGTPIPLKNYQTLYHKSPSLAAQQLTKDLKAAIAQEVIIIDSKEDEALTEQLLILMRNEKQHYHDSFYNTHPHRLRLEQSVATTCNQLSKSQKIELSQQTNHYFAQLKQLQLTDQAVQQKGQFSWSNFLRSVLLAPLALLGWMGGFLPVTSARYLRNQNVEDPQFWAAMAMIFSLLTWLVYSLFIAFLGAFFFDWKAILIPPLLVVLQYISFLHQEYLSEFLNNRTYRQLLQQQPQQIQSLQTERKALAVATEYLILSNLSTSSQDQKNL